MNVTVTSSNLVQSSNDMSSSELVSTSRSRELSSSDATSALTADQRAQLRPVLRGKLSFASPNSKLKSKGDESSKEAKQTVVWEGSWWLSSQHYSEPFDFGSNATASPFRFERKSFDNSSQVSASSSSSPEISNTEILTLDGYFSGSFFLNVLNMPSSSNSKQSYVRKEFKETNLLLRFKENSSESYDVFGSGENSFGQFLIEGTFNIKTCILSCVRNYLPKQFNFESNNNNNNNNNLLLTISPKGKKSKKSEKEEISCKRSERVKRPNKYFQTFFLDSPTVPPTAKRPRTSFSTSSSSSTSTLVSEAKKCEKVFVESFEGQKEIVSLLESLISLDKLDGNLVSSKLLTVFGLTSLTSISKEVERIFTHCISLHKHSKRSVDKLDRLLSFFFSSFKNIQNKINDLNLTLSQLEKDIEHDFDLFDEFEEAENESDPISVNEAAALPPNFTFSNSFDIKSVFRDYKINVKRLKEEEWKFGLEELDSQTIKTLNDNADFVSPPGKGG